MLEKIARTRLLGHLPVVEKARTLCLLRPLRMQTCDTIPMKRYTVLDPETAMPTPSESSQSGELFQGGNCARRSRTEGRDCLKVRVLSTRPKDESPRTVRSFNFLICPRKPYRRAPSPIYDSVRFISCNPRTSASQKYDIMNHYTVKGQPRAAALPCPGVHGQGSGYRRINEGTTPEVKWGCDEYRSGCTTRDWCRDKDCSSGTVLPRGKRKNFIRVKVNMKEIEPPPEGNEVKRWKPTRIFKTRPTGYVKPAEVEGHNCEACTMNCVAVKDADVLPKPISKEPETCEKKWVMPPAVLPEPAEPDIPKVRIFPDKPDLPTKIEDQVPSEKCYNLPEQVPDVIENGFVNFSKTKPNMQSDKCQNSTGCQEKKSCPPSPMMSGSYEDCSCCKCNCKQESAAQQSYSQQEPEYSQGQQTITGCQSSQESCCTQGCSPKENNCAQRSNLVLALEKGRCEIERAAQKTQCELDALAKNLAYQKDKAIAALEYNKQRAIQGAQCNVKSIEDNIKYQKEVAHIAINNAVKAAKVNVENLEETLRHKKDLFANTLKYQKDKALHTALTNVKEIETQLKYQKDKAANTIAQAVESTKYHVNEIGKNVQYQKDKAAVNLNNIFTNAKCQINHLEENIKHKKDLVANNVKYHAGKALQTTKCTVDNIEQSIKHKKDLVTSHIKYHTDKTVQNAKCTMNAIDQNIQYHKDRTNVAVNNIKNEVKGMKCRVNQAAQSTVANINYKVKAGVAEQTYRVQYAVAKLNWLLKWQMTKAKYHKDKIAVGVHNMGERVKKEVGELVDFIQKCLRLK
ncbi:uncharacterized protein LOC106670802 [Cimex lectularius]|uniref:Uncharacterized protein n=1 Tax=Cimex lectularius TaxID=79782 RepID=A0A8I6SBR2_CIMLE|nr:uncharacterized protein LOC106670802 [Cimex lectularius]